MKPSYTAQASVSAGMGNWITPAQTSELVAFIWLKLNRKGLSFGAFKVSKSRNVWNRHGFESNPPKDTPPCLGGLCTGREAGDDGSCGRGWMVGGHQHVRPEMTVVVPKLASSRSMALEFRLIFWRSTCPRPGLPPWPGVYVSCNNRRKPLCTWDMGSTLE